MVRERDGRNPEVDDGLSVVSPLLSYRVIVNTLSARCAVSGFVHIHLSKLSRPTIATRC